MAGKKMEDICYHLLQGKWSTHADRRTSCRARERDPVQVPRHLPEMWQKPVWNIT